VAYRERAGAAVRASVPVALSPLTMANGPEVEKPCASDRLNSHREHVEEFMRLSQQQEECAETVDVRASVARETG
jgi:hypothetical protein